ncbi:UDP-N-acetylmuramoyl-L-alanyl-D-glutamate--2,6-diaminopimelate ligase [Candidatus Omnitrophota bacterium]
MKLSDLTKSYEISFNKDISDIEITSITSSSKEVVKGTLFVAIQGATTDGHLYINDAYKKGAVAIILEENKEGYGISIPLGVTGNTKEMYCKLLHSFYSNPSQNLSVIGITGTNGKTTTSFLLKHILSAHAGVGLIGTIHAVINDETFNLNNTTPDLSIVNSLMMKMHQNNVAYCVMEVSSHALEQKRIVGTCFSARVFTNLTQDHLDYHASMEAYYESKKKLFTEYSSGAVSVINIDDSFGERLYNEIKGQKISYGCSSNADVFASDINAGLNSIQFTVNAFGKQNKVMVPLACFYNVYNILAAIATSLSFDLELDEIVQSLSSFNGVAGRMERVSVLGDIPVFVDYAHTPDAFLNVLKAIRAIHQGKLITVFGCGGDRDTGKRPKMGALATQYSDHVIITNDNPRTEDPEQIINGICKGIEKEAFNLKCKIIYDRKKAIEEACAIAGNDSLVLILGKGHEQYQIMGHEKKYFSDQDVVRGVMKGCNAINSGSE